MDDLLGVIEPAVGVPSLPVVNDKPPSAVLMTLWDGPAGPEMLLTRRAWHLRSHTGEVSFPGGRLEPGDRDLVHTALREAEEEVALDPGSVEVQGLLTPLTTVSSPAEILPVVAVSDGMPSTAASPDEVDAVLHVSVAELWNAAHYREEIWSRAGTDIEITFFELEGDTLWGATARIIRSLFEQLADPS